MHSMERRTVGLSRHFLYSCSPYSNYLSTSMGPLFVNVTCCLLAFKLCSDSLVLLSYVSKSTSMWAKNRLLLDSLLTKLLLRFMTCTIKASKTFAASTSVEVLTDGIGYATLSNVALGSVQGLDLYNMIMCKKRTYHFERVKRPIMSPLHL